MDVRSFYDNDTCTWTYVLICTATKACAIIDSVLDFDIRSASTTTTSAAKLLALVKDEGLKVEWILETHVHADHLTAAAHLKDALGGSPKIAIGARIVEVLQHWIPIFNTADDTPADGSQFDHLFKDGETFQVGQLAVKVMYTPGHTPACVTYVVGDVAFAGDTIFMPKVGTARTDFPGGSAAVLFESANRLLNLPAGTRIFVGHDYPEGSDAPTHEASIEIHKKENVMVNERVSLQEFVDANQEKLTVPRLLLPSLQVNLRAGRLGKPESNGTQYIKLPLNLFA